MVPIIRNNNQDEYRVLSIFRANICVEKSGKYKWNNSILSQINPTMNSSNI